MTAEIALLNKMAVALAADSAVTIDAGRAAKVYNSADKIFEGTLHDPIAVMVYNRPELNGIPVEVIVKMYRDQRCRTAFATVFDYADAFLAHLVELDTPQVTINTSITTLILPRLRGIKETHDEISDQLIRSWTSGGVQFDDIEALLAFIDDRRAEYFQIQQANLAIVPDATWANGLTVATVLDAHGEHLTRLIIDVFGEEVPETTRDSVLQIAALSLLKEWPAEQLTGLVFAGFGHLEIFPSLISYEVYGTVAGRLKFQQIRKFDVDRKLDPEAGVFPFAQKEMVDRFMFGLDGEFLELCNTYFAGALEKLKGELAEHLPDLDEAVTTGIATSIDGVLSEFRDGVVEGHLKRLHGELSEMVRLMPKQELAALSESLVHITSLKRKFSAEAESVGGPIDVAVITRAEGFVWVKRKHYFNPELNPRFFHRRYGKPPEEVGQAVQPGDEAA
jgi:hypothetical protein